MVCYLDTTFCCSPDCVGKCGRRLSPEVLEAAKVWWGDDDPPIAVACFCGPRKALPVPQDNETERSGLFSGG